MGSWKAIEKGADSGSSMERESGTFGARGRIRGEEGRWVSWEGDRKGRRRGGEAGRQVGRWATKRGEKGGA